MGIGVVGIGVLVGVEVGLGVEVASGGVPVGVGVGVLVAVGVGVGLGVTVGLGVLVGVAVGVRVGVKDGLGVEVGKEKVVLHPGKGVISGIVSTALGFDSGTEGATGRVSNSLIRQAMAMAIAAKTTFEKMMIIKIIFLFIAIARLP